jgi:hypothetical protein
MDITGEATLSVVADFPAGKNMLAGRQVLLMGHRLCELLRAAGFDLPPQTSPGQAWVAFMNACEAPKDYDALNSKVSEDIVTGFTMPADGQGAFDDSVAAGTYYVSSQSSLSEPVILVWEVEVDAKPGANAVVLNDFNAEPIR